jgi:hypothetical protein
MPSKGSSPQRTSKTASAGEILEIVEYLSPKPSPFRLLRIGGKIDGAYLVPDCLEDVEACFSPGVANRKYFEDDLLERFGIKSFLLDFSSSEREFLTPLVPGEQFFLKKWLGAEPSKEKISLTTWVADQGLEESRDLILQMDIEGAEFENILNTPREELSRFRIIVMEVHDIASRLIDGDFEKTLLPMIRHLSKEFVVVHCHPNNCCGSVDFPEVGFSVPENLEVTMLRRDLFETGTSSKVRKPRSPHFLDIARNDPRKSPMFLGRGWGHFGFSAVRLLLIFRLWLVYVFFLMTNPSDSLSKLKDWAYRWKVRILGRYVNRERG